MSPDPHASGGSHLSSGGGHGTIRVALPAGATERTVPSVPGETNTLPAGVVKEESHRGPMTRPASAADRGKLLGTGIITLGRY